MSDKLSNFNALTSFKYQAYLMYMILDKYSMHFQSLLGPEQWSPYDVISIIHRDSFFRDLAQGFSQFVNEFVSRVYYLSMRSIIQDYLSNSKNIFIHKQKIRLETRSDILNIL